MQLSERGANFIANFEGFRSSPYWDVNHWSIGYGTHSHEGDGPVTRKQAMNRLLNHVDEHYAPAVRALGVKLNQNQFDALVSLAYNLGPGVMEGPVGDRLKQGRYSDAANAMLAYNRAGGQVLPGLTRRREEERRLFLRKPPIAYTKAEAHLLKVLKETPKNTARHDRAVHGLRDQARDIQRLARRTKDGWQAHDRGRRYQGIRRALRRYA